MLGIACLSNFLGLPNIMKNLNHFSRGDEYPPEFSDIVMGITR